MNEEKMLSRTQDSVGYIIFNNPEKHNAVSVEMWDALEKFLNQFREDNNIRVVVLEGAGGKSFVSGADISKFDKERSTKEAVLSYNKRTQKVYELIEAFPKPTIAKINGYCIGGGLNLAVCCDIRICSEKSQFAMPAAKLSLGYPFSSIKRLFDILGPGMAKHFMFTDAKISSKSELETCQYLSVICIITLLGLFMSNQQITFQTCLCLLSTSRGPLPRYGRTRHSDYPSL